MERSLFIRILDRLRSGNSRPSRAEAKNRETLHFNIARILDLLDAVCNSFF